MSQWLALNASLVRFPQDWFDRVSNELGQENVYLPWYDSVRGIDYIVEGTFFVKADAMTVSMSEFLNGNRVFTVYEVKEKDIVALRKIESKMTDPTQKTVATNKLVTVASRSYIYNGMRAMTLRIYNDNTALCRVATRSFASYEVVPCHLLTEEWE